MPSARASALPGLALLLLLPFLLAAPLRAGGVVEVVDGDTMLVNGEIVRLLGIDAPDKDETCPRNGGSFPCGREALHALAALVAGRPVRCDGLETGRFGTVIVAACRAGGTDLGHEMVRRGWARADRRYASRYAHVEATARAAGRGIWAAGLRP